jgi:signal transduction histidine kinase
VLGAVLHDVRTPLSVVHTITAMLLNPKYNLTPEQVREQHERIRRNVEHMNSLLGELADLVHLRSGRLSITPKPLRLNEVLSEAVSAQQTLARDKGLKLHLDTGASEMPAEADRTRLLQMFRHLIGNAVHSANTGDDIRVSSRVIGKHANIEIAGGGIPVEDLPHVFDPYHLAGTKKRKAGMALGLYIAKGIVEAHGGTIRCLSQPGGTTFDVSLPLST